MANPVPTPVAAALGLVPTVLDGVRRLPSKAVQVPVIAVSTALAAVDAARREYDDLAARGQELVARLRGGSFDAFEDRVEDRLKGTPVAGLYDKAEDALEDVGEAVGKAARTAGSGLSAAAGRVEKLAGTVAGETTTAGGNAAAAVAAGTQRAAERSEAASAVAESADVPTPPDAEQPKGVPTPKASAPDTNRVDSAATAEVVEIVEEVAVAVQAEPVTSRDELPLADYDHMTLGALRGRLRSLDLEQLVQLRDYEKSKADRLPVVTMLDNRIAKLATSPEVPNPPAELPPAADNAAGGGSKVSPATSATSSPSPLHTKVRTT
jgi:hypothetical protein